MLTLAESCTGGMVAEIITSVAGSSAWFDCGFVTYSNQSKIEELGVDFEILNKYGAVSDETAYAMAYGLLNKTNLDMVLSITGIAGPDGGSETKPVGLVYICIMDKNKHKIFKCNISGNRISVQNKAATRALNELRKFLIE